MKKRLLFLILVFTISFSFGQNKPKGDTTKTTLEEIISQRITVPPSPTAASLGKYGEFPVSNYTGTPSISIPLLNAQGRDLSIPVSLNYHASGIRVQQMSSWVGLGWSLSAGGVITRTINGLNDTATSGLRGSQSKKDSIQNYIACINGAGSNCDSTYYTLLQRISDGFVDSEPDVYSFNFMGKSGKIVFDYDGVPQLIPYQKMLVDFNATNNTFTITDDMGMVYFFDQTEGSQNNSTDAGYGPNGGTTAWYMSKVTTVQGEDILFTYGSEPINYDLNVTNLVTYEAGDFFECGSGISYNNITGNYSSQAKVLQQISTVNEDIFFELTTPSDVPCYENATPWKVATPLKRIVKKDKAGNVEMGCDFWYSCYPNSNRRLRLDSLKMFGSDNAYLPPHTFAYTETPGMPGWVNDHQDYWGYNNGNATTNNSYLPEVTNANIFSIYTNLVGYDREPDPTEVKAFSLEQITYPTGGYTDFEFEVNEYGFRGQVANNGGNENGAGIRIGKISSHDGVQETGIKLFDYTLSNSPTVSSGSIITLPVYDYYREYYVQDQNNPLGRKLCRAYDRSSNPKNFLSETQGSQVGYREVTVLDGMGGANGKTVYKYTSPYGNNDTGSNGFPFASLTDKDHKRGLLTDALVYQKTATGYELVKHTTNTYELNETANQSKRTYIKVGIERRSLGDGPTTPFANEYEREQYDYLSEWVYLTNTNTLHYFDGAAVSQDAAYTYNPFNLRVKSITTTGSNNEVYRTTTTYPNELNLALLTNRHILSVPLETKKELDNVQIYKEVHTYGTTGIGNPVLTKVEVYPNGIETAAGKMSEEYTYNDYGNIIETERNNSGVTTSYLWGYNHSRVLCQAQNIPYSNLVSVFNSNSLTLGEFGDAAPTTTQITNIRSFLSGIGSNVLGTFYTYNVVRGLTHSFVPNGLLTTYSYDNFGRLKSVKDNQGAIVDLYNYKYQNQPFNSLSYLNVSADKNAILHSKFRIATTDELKYAYPDSAITTIQYLDGLGRQIQTVGFAHSPSKTDVILEDITYDAFSRSVINTLPAPSANFSGSYEPAASTLANLFYKDDAAINETTEFDNSPLSRPKVMYGAGQVWRDSLRNTQLFYGLAGAEIRRYVFAADSSINISGTFPVNSLFKNVTVDEQRDTTITFTDKRGRLVQQWAQDESGYIITSYVYDGLDRPLAIIQPEGYEVGGKFAYKTQKYQDYIFSYVYDARGRLKKKHVPGGGWTSYVYDKRDQVVLEQSALQELYNLWSFTKYDVFGRIAITGELESNRSQSTLQTDFDGVSVSFETRSVNSYNGASFPSVITATTPVTYQFNYYDNYDWIENHWKYRYQLFDQDTHYVNSKGLFTGRWAVTTEDTAARYYDVHHYDNKGRLGASYLRHLRNGHRIYNSVVPFGSEDVPLIRSFGYNFIGDLILDNPIWDDGEEIIFYKTSSFDHMGRITKKGTSLNGAANDCIFMNGSWNCDLATYDYDGIGRLAQATVKPQIQHTVPALPDSIIRPPNPGMGVLDVAKRYILLQPTTEIDPVTIENYTAVIDTTQTSILINGLQTINYDYHIRGGLLGMNLGTDKSPYPSPADGDLFAYRLDYENTGRWDGNIGQQRWHSAPYESNDREVRSYAFSYDPAKRLEKALYNGVGGEDFSIPLMSYDKNGNITNLQRNGNTGTGFDSIDNLNYTYSGNRLISVTDASSSPEGLKQIASGAYTYYPDGSLKSDANEGISLILYDTHLKQPKEIQLTDGRWIKHYYTGNGELNKTLYSTGEKWFYTKELTLKNDQLYQIAFPEGRINYRPLASGSWHFEYFLTDHLGNTRVTFKDSTTTDENGLKNHTLLKTAETAFDPWGVRLNGVGSVNGFQNRWEMQGKEREQTFGLNRVNFGARIYNPTIGRFDRIDPLAELDFHLGSYVYVGDDPVNSVDMFGMYKKKIKKDTYEETVPFDEVTVTAKRLGSKTSSYSMMQLASMSYTRNISIHGEASPYRKHFQDGGAIASGVLLAPVAAIGAAELGAGAAVSQGARYLANLKYASAGRWMLRKSIFLLKPRIGLNSTGAAADFASQFLTNGYSLDKINYFSVGGNLVSNNPLVSGAITTISSAGEDRTFTNFLINSGGNALGNSPSLLLGTYSKIGFRTVTVGAGAIPRANFMGNIVSKGVAESVKKQANE